jgi:PAS domain S-box-containing protein
MRGEMLAQVSDAVIAIDTKQQVTYLNAAAEDLYGVSTPVVLGQRLGRIYTSLWPTQEIEIDSVEALIEHGAWRGETVHVRHDGQRLDVDSSLTVLRDPMGRVAGMLGVHRDNAVHKRAERAVLISEIRYRRLFEAAHDGVLLVDPRTRLIIEANPYMTRLLDYPHAELVGKELFEIGLLKDEAASQAMIRELKTTSQVRYDHLPLAGRDGSRHEVEVVANLYDEDGSPIIQCNIRDITERKRAEEHVKLLMAEVNHRAKNLLAVVQAVAQQTVKHGDPATFAARLTERIAGLAAGQDLLVRNQWQGVDVSELICVQLDHFKDLIGTRILIEGPSVLLTTTAAQGIGMALHELTTNAAKYGSLSNAHGKVRIAWSVTTGGEPVFAMSWREEGGPPVIEPERSGFGRIVIGRMAEAAVDGIVHMEFRREGFSWVLSTALENVLAVPAEGAETRQDSHAR